MRFAASPFSLTLLSLGLFCTSLSAQRPGLSYGGTLGTAGPGVRRSFLGHPDQTKILVDGGNKRANQLAVLLYSLRMLPKSLPFGPDFLDIGPGTIFFTLPGLLNSQGKWNSGFPVPASVPKGTSFAVQAMVWAKGEAAPLRFTRGKTVRIVDGGTLDLYVDGDATIKGNGSPFLPFQTITEAINAANIKKGGRIHIEPAKNSYMGTPQSNNDDRFHVGTNTWLIGESWSGTRTGRPTLQGTLAITGTSTQALTNVTIQHLRVLLPVLGKKTVARCLRALHVQGLLIDNCLFEGTSGGQTSSLRGIILGKSVKGTIQHCTIRNLRVGPKPPRSTIAAYGIVMLQDNQVTVRNCWIHDLLDQPFTARVTFFYVVGIACGANQPDSAKNLITITNNLIGPLSIPKPLGNNPYSDADLFGVHLAFGTQGSIRNNVFHKLDLSQLTSRTQQIFGLQVYETGKKVEITNNIFADFKLGKVTGSFRWSVAMEGISTPRYTYKASHSCVWNVAKPFLGKTVVPGSVILLKDPLLLPPVYVLKPGSPCLNSGNPLYPPKHMGIYGGSFPGRAGIRR
jgi:hypothetical protein